MAKKNRPSPLIAPLTAPIDCACVIHGDAYSWNYVERLYSMLSRHITPGVRLHVYTEAHRVVPAPFIKHELLDWNIYGPKKAWWYKMQMFNAKTHYKGPLLYLDLDVVITGNIDWICRLPLQYFWAVRDFKYLWRETHYAMNSSIMWWDTWQYAPIWREFSSQDIRTVTKQHHGDQDYLDVKIPKSQLRYFDTEMIRSWRWQALDGGYNFKKRTYLAPGTGTNIANNTSVLVFHGHPKPDQIQDPVIIQHWQ